MRKDYTSSMKTAAFENPSADQPRPRFSLGLLLYIMAVLAAMFAAYRAFGVLVWFAWCFIPLISIAIYQVWAKRRVSSQLIAATLITGLGTCCMPRLEEENVPVVRELECRNHVKLLGIGVRG